jgi:hypothetical protein
MRSAAFVVERGLPPNWSETGGSIFGARNRVRIFLQSCAGPVAVTDSCGRQEWLALWRLDCQAAGAGLRRLPAWSSTRVRVREPDIEPAD